LIAIPASGASIGDVSGDRDGATPFVSISAALSDATFDSHGALPNPYFQCDSPLTVVAI
jgi:hypothetical protein